MDLGLKDKRAFISGSSRGLGYATAHELAKEGCRVVLNSRDEEKVKTAAEVIAKGTGTPAFGVAGDVSDTSMAETLINSAVELMGGLDILITNAGGPPAGSFDPRAAGRGPGRPGERFTWPLLARGFSAPVTLLLSKCDVALGAGTWWGGAWSPDGRYLFIASGPSPTDAALSVQEVLDHELGPHVSLSELVGSPQTGIWPYHWQP